MSRRFDKSFQICLDIGGTNSLRVRGRVIFVLNPHGPGAACEACYLEPFVGLSF